jgi:putative membrane protein
LRSLKDYILLYIKGIAMGSAGVIPGVSGGTVAFLTGIYDELLRSITAIDTEALKLLTRLEFAAFWKKVNGNFLLVLVVGIVTGLLSLAKLTMYLLRHHPISIRSFFFGLILISAPFMFREIKKWSPLAVLSFIIGVAIAYSITVLSPIQSPDSIGFVFFAGALAICAMVLPGVSGVFILLLIGKYQFIVTSLMNFDILVILAFIMGCLAGILSFSRFLLWILDNYHSATVALLTGFMVGSLNKVWPWREVLEYVTSSKGEQVPVFDKSVLPWHFMATTNKDPQVFQAILMMALGVFIVVLLEKIATRLKTKI